MVNVSHYRCCGCSACATICPKQAIIMREDTYGYIFPNVDLEKCINCGLCDKICPELSILELNEPKAVYASVSREKSEHATYASGGAATVFARHIIRHGGVVYGCAQQNCRTIGHIRINDERDVALLKGSKYVQSETVGIYAAVKKDLQAGVTVLFIGTPCQAAALRSYLQKDYDNLITIDLVCHGVPSQRMLRDAVEPYLNNIKTSYENIFVNFRWKTQYGIQFGIQFGNKAEILKSYPKFREPYMTAFAQRLSYRESCYQCPYANPKRVGDITLGDFWGLGNKLPSAMNCNTGVSLVMVNTLHGEELWAATSYLFDIEERTKDEAIKFNDCLKYPTVRPAQRDLFLDTYQRQGIFKASAKCNRRYKFESMLIVRFVRSVPAFEQSAKYCIGLIRKMRNAIKS